MIKETQWSLIKRGNASALQVQQIGSAGRTTVRSGRQFYPLFSLIALLGMTLTDRFHQLGLANILFLGN